MSSANGQSDGVIDKMRSYMYGWLFGADNPIATQHGFEQVLATLPKGSRVLDVGVGDGIYFANPKCVKLIKERNLTIYAIDVDTGATPIADKRAVASGLREQVKCEGRDLLDLTEEKDGLFDVILFFESFPVIPRKLFKRLVKHATTVLKSQGYMVMYHVLEPVSKPIVRALKPYVYYITMVDFGQECTVDEMHGYCEEWGYAAKQRDISPCLQTTYKEMFKPFQILPVVKDWVITTYTTKLTKA